MSHILSSAVSVAAQRISNASADAATDSHQPGLSPPLSPADDRDIELMAPEPAAAAAAPPANSPLRERGASAPISSLQLPSTNAAPATPATTDEIALDVSVGPSTSAAFSASQAAAAATSSSSQHPAANSSGHLQFPDASNGGSFAAYPPTRVNSSYRGVSMEETDPLLLRSRLVEDHEIRRRHSGKGRGRKAEKMVRNFYSAQNEHINRLLKPMAKHGDDDAEDRASSALKVKVAVYGSIVANFVLAILQLYAAISSLSLSLFATAADSVFDPFANLVLNWLHRKAAKVDERKWPIGGSRFEPIGNITYAAIMGMVSAILVVQSIQDLAKGEDDRQLHIPALVAVAVAFFTKLVLAVYCFGLRKYSSQVEVLYQDHRNDLFINGFGIFTSAAGATIAGWLDPAGALVISLAIITSWTRTAYLEFKQLAGAAAPTDFLQLVTYNAAIFSDEIQAIESVRAYSSGPRYIVEIDIVMHPETPLWKSHDVSQLLQDNLEHLPMVERAFIHVDYDIFHDPEHRKSA